MRTRLLVVASVVAALLVGVAVGVGGLWYAEELLRDTLAPTIFVSGELLREDNPDASASALPPEGYYLASEEIGRIYVEHELARDAVGRQIRASGRLTVRCGPDQITCYPTILATSLTTDSP